MSPLMFVPLIVGVIGLVFTIVVLGHDSSITQAKTDALMNKWYNQLNSTSSCADLKSMIYDDNQYWLKNTNYGKLMQLYSQNNCDEVLKK